jgi:hypothetical protein
MQTIHAIYENGVFRPVEPVDLPDRCEVEVEVRKVQEGPKIAGRGESHVALATWPCYFFKMASPQVIGNAMVRMRPWSHVATGPRGHRFTGGQSRAVRLVRQASKPPPENGFPQPAQ